MFTGLIEEIGTVITRRPYALQVQAHTVLEGTRLGDSITINGACLTVTACTTDSFTVGISPETWRRTNLGKLKPRDKVNLERAVMVGQRLGGHYVQGHIDGTARLESSKADGDALLIRFNPPATLLNYIVEKGFIAIDGASLTITHVDARSFEISLIAYSQLFLTLPNLHTGDEVNIEVDILAKYVEKLLSGQREEGTKGVKGELTSEKLAKYGFLK